MTEPADLAARLASHGLGARSVEPCELRADGAVGAIAAAARANLLGLLACLVAEGVVRAPADVAAQIRDAAVRRLISDMRIERWCGAVVECLHQEGILVRVLKGISTAQLDHPNPAHRSTTDVDLLVSGKDLRRAVALVGALGYRRDLPERRRRFDERFAKDITLFGSGEVPELDLHRTLVTGPFGLALDPAGAFEEGEPLVLAGSVEAVSLSLPWRLLHSCLVVGAGDVAPSMGMFRDLALQARNPDLDVERFRTLVVGSRSAPAVAEGLRRTMTGLGIDLPHLVGSDRGAPEWWLRTYEAHGGTDVSSQIGAVVALPWRDRLPYLVALASPSGDYRRARSSAGRTSPAQLLLDSVPTILRRKRDWRMPHR